MKYIDETGHRYGRLTVLRKYGSSGGAYHGKYWLCLCDCGTETAVRGTDLRRGLRKSCGCLVRMSAEERKAAGYPLPPNWGQHRGQKSAE